MKNKLMTLWLGCLSFISFTAVATMADPFADLLKKLEEYVKKYPTEKVYLHFDKPYYAIGDDIWFKAYVVDGSTGEPTAISNILYVDLINPKDSLLKQLKISMKGGIAWGDLRLTDSLEEGNYRIRAYTQWMRNAGPSFFFDKQLKVGNAWTNNIFVKSNQKITKEGAGERFTSSLFFNDKNGKPLANNQVTYEVFINNKSMLKGKAMTTFNGEVKVSALSAISTSLRKGLIKASVMLIDGTQVTKEIPFHIPASEADIQFFPEGGHLIEGLPTKIAFKSTNGIGKGEDVSGTVIDNEGTEILSFESSYLGMGTFTLNPSPGKSYTAKVKLASGLIKSIILPKALPSGYNLAINNLDSTKIGVKVLLSPDLLNKGELNLIAHRNGMLLFAAKVPSARQIASLSIQKENLPSGVVTLTLFSPENLAVAERIAFVNNLNDKIDVNIAGLNASYSKKQEVKLDLSANNNTKGTQGSFSASITNASVQNPDPENESNIFTSLLLTSDIKGYIEKPNHYFLSDNSTTRAELDQLMLTQGWRKLNWNNLNGPTDIKFKAEKSMAISGTVTSGGKPVAKGKVSLFSSSRGIFAVDTLTDDNGRFSFDQIEFNDGVRFTIKAVTAKNSDNVKVVMDQIAAQEITPSTNWADIEINVNESIKEYLNQSLAYLNEQEKQGFISKVTKLKAVEIMGKKVNKVENSSNMNGPGNADNVFSAEELKNTISLTQFLNGRVAGVNVTRGVPSNMRNGLPMTVYVDGSVFIDGNSGEAVSVGNLDDIAVSDIESIEILKSIAYTTLYGHAGANGIIIITTKTGKSSVPSTNAPGIIAASPKGLFANRQFYSPKYDASNEAKADYRTTVYWNPHIVTDTNGKATINYNNTDQVGKYRIVVEGIDAAGNLARKVLEYEVK